MSARSSTDISLHDEGALLGHEKYHQPSTLRPRRSIQTRLYGYLACSKWLMILGTQVLLLYQVRHLLQHQHSHPPIRNGDEINGFAPRLSTQITHPVNEMDFYISNYTSDEDMTTIRSRWVELLPKGGGNILIKDHKSYPDLTAPIEDPSGPIYVTTWTHQLHCLFYVMTEYDRIVRHGPNGLEKVIPPGFHSVHTRHCFEILRQSILCHMDMTLEGSMPGSPSGTTGFGHAHVCQNRQEAREWMEANRGFDETLIIKEG
ncbi:hypothetical protein PG995_013139 [Apiospora arundinis]